MEANQFPTICRLCAQENSYSVDTSELIQVEENQQKQLKFLIISCLEIELCKETNSRCCMECIGRLQFIYNFKQFCKRNNDTYFFRPPAVEAPAMEALQMGNEQFMIKEEPINNPAVRQTSDDYSEFIEVFKTEDVSPKIKRRMEENRKNALRQREKRANETPEQREMRRHKVAEQARMRRLKKKIERPEEYKVELARVAEAKRLRRQALSDEERAEWRTRESEAVRLRRQQLTPEQRALYRQKERDAKRARRSGNFAGSFSPVSSRSSISESMEPNSWPSEIVLKAES